MSDFWHGLFFVSVSSLIGLGYSRRRLNELKRKRQGMLSCCPCLVAYLAFVVSSKSNLFGLPTSTVHFRSLLALYLVGISSFAGGGTSPPASFVSERSWLAAEIRIRYSPGGSPRSGGILYAPSVTVAPDECPPGESGSNVIVPLATGVPSNVTIPVAPCRCRGSFVPHPTSVAVNRLMKQSAFSLEFHIEMPI